MPFRLVGFVIQRQNGFRPGGEKKERSDRMGQGLRKIHQKDHIILRGESQNRIFSGRVVQAWDKQYGYEGRRRESQ